MIQLRVDFVREYEQPVFPRHSRDRLAQHRKSPDRRITSSERVYLERGNDLLRNGKRRLSEAEVVDLSTLLFEAGACFVDGESRRWPNTSDTRIQMDEVRGFG